jgi:hypothetical protein
MLSSDAMDSGGLTCQESSSHTKRSETWVKSFLLICFIIGMYLQFDMGYADNGDFTRSMEAFTSGPVGIEPNFPSLGTEAWPKRFFNYWIPYWKLDWPRKLPTTSTPLLWLPGILLNYSLYSSTILYMPLISLFPKVILFGILLLLFKWVETQTNHKAIFLLCLVAPLVLMLTTTSYLAYFNSYYQETGGIVYLLLLLISLIYLKKRPGVVSLLCCFAATMLLSTAKVAYFYWPLLSMPFVVIIWCVHKRIKWFKAALGGMILMAALTCLSIHLTRTYIYNPQSYLSLFNGALTFSDNSAEHLHRLGMDDAISKVDIPPFSTEGGKIISRHYDKMSFLNTINVICHEPVVGFRMIYNVLDNMQDISLEYLGTYSFDDPRSHERLSMAPNSQLKPPAVPKRSEDYRVWHDAKQTKPLNLWATLKYKLFPTGYALAIALVLYPCWFIFGLLHRDFVQELSMIGLLTTIACCVDMSVAIFGAGKYELIKHLLLSNVLFDIASIAFVNSVLFFCIKRFEHKPANLINTMP